MEDIVYKGAIKKLPFAMGVFSCASNFQTAFPHANQKLLDSYKQDSICDTWETLANIVGFIYKGKSFAEIGKEKYRWADSISPHIVLERNQSPSFQHLLATVKAIV